MKVHTLLDVHLLSAVMKPQCRAACWPRSFYATLVVVAGRIALTEVSVLYTLTLSLHLDECMCVTFAPMLDFCTGKSDTHVTFAPQTVACCNIVHITKE
jgi:hypothetical protein